jgi:hypothetical protein
MLLPISVKFKYNTYISRRCVLMSLDDSDELAYLWTKVKFIQKYMSKHNCSYEVAEREFHTWIEGLMDSRIERANKMLNSH